MVVAIRRNRPPTIEHLSVLSIYYIRDGDCIELVTRADPLQSCHAF